MFLLQECFKDFAIVVSKFLEGELNFSLIDIYMSNGLSIKSNPMHSATTFQTLSSSLFAFSKRI